MKTRVSHDMTVGLYRLMVLTWLSAGLTVAVSAQSLDERLQRNCMGCDAAGIADAPRYQSMADWSARLDGKGWQELIDNAMTGIGRMPSRGYCVNCTRDDIDALIRRMVPVGIQPDKD